MSKALEATKKEYNHLTTMLILKYGSMREAVFETMLNQELYSALKDKERDIIVFWRDKLDISVTDLARARARAQKVSYYQKKNIINDRS